jgi:flagellar hook protein FlgE
MGWFLRFPKRATRSRGHKGKPRQSTLGLFPYHRRLLCEALEARTMLSVSFVRAALDNTFHAGNAAQRQTVADLPVATKTAISSAIGAYQAASALPSAFARNDVIGNNLANANTMGFKASDLHFATQFLQPLQIPVCTASVAKATTEAILQGTLTPVGVIANTASILQTGPLTVGSVAQPASSLTAAVDLGAHSVPVAGNLSGTYKYYVTFYNSKDNVESRPQLVATTSPTLTDNQVTLSNFPAPSSGTWTDERIYRSTNVAGDTNLYEVTDIPIATAIAANYTYTDNATDASIRAGANLNPPGTHILSFSGPPARSTTLLSNLVEYNSTAGTYTTPFPTTGTLSFTGTVGGDLLPAQTFKITNTSTVKDLANFLQGALGIQSPPGNDPNNPIPVDSVSGEAAGVTITTNGQINVVGNNGTANSVAIGLSALQLTSGNPPMTTSVNLPFNSIQSAAGQGTSTTMVAYDSLGIPLSVSITAVLQSVTSSATTYRWYADCPQNEPGRGQQGIAVGTGTVTFNGEGNFVSASNTTVSIGRANEPSVKTLQFKLDFSQVSGLASSSASLAVANADGSAPGPDQSHDPGKCQTHPRQAAVAGTGHQRLFVAGELRSHQPAMANDDYLLSQNEIERLFGHTKDPAATARR